MAILPLSQASATLRTVNFGIASINRNAALSNKNVVSNSENINSFGLYPADKKSQVVAFKGCPKTEAADMVSSARPKATPICSKDYRTYQMITESFDILNEAIDLFNNGGMKDGNVVAEITDEDIYRDRYMTEYNSDGSISKRSRFYRDMGDKEYKIRGTEILHDDGTKDMIISRWLHRYIKGYKENPENHKIAIKEMVEIDQDGSIKYIKNK